MFLVSQLKKLRQGFCLRVLLVGQPPGSTKQHRDLYLLDRTARVFTMPERDDKLSAAVTPQLKLETPPPLTPKLPAIPTPKIDMVAKLGRKWNTKNLGLRLGVDAVAAASAAALIAPVVSIIDK